MSLTQLIIEKMKRLPTPDLPKLISFLRTELNLDPEAFAKLLGTTERSVRRWEKGELEPSGVFAAKLVEFKHLVMSGQRPTSLRLNEVLILMQQVQRLSRLNIEKLASLMDLPRPTELRKYFEDEEEPTYEFLDRFADVFGVNPNWLKFGEDYPYSDSKLTKDINPCDAFESLYEYVVSNTVIEKLKPRGIVFVKSNSKVGQAVIIFEIQEWKYLTCFDPYHISEHGSGGTTALVRLYKFIKQIEHTKYESLCSGRVISEDSFQKLIEGKVFPGLPISESWPVSWWWEDLMDLSYRKHEANYYERFYGEGFTAAQTLIRRRLEEEEARERSK